MNRVVLMFNQLDCPSISQATFTGSASRIGVHAYRVQSCARRSLGVADVTKGKDAKPCFFISSYL